MDGAGKMGAEEAKPPEGKGEWAHSRQEEEEMTRAPQVLFHGGKSGEPEQEEQLSKEWEDAKRWSKMDQLAKELNQYVSGHFVGQLYLLLSVILRVFNTSQLIDHLH